MLTRCCLFATVITAAHVVSAQSQNQGSQIFTSSVSYHVTDESRTPYENWLKDKFQRFAESLMKEEPALRSVIATRVIYGGVQEPEANAYISYATEGIPKRVRATQDKVAKQLFDKSYDDFLAEARPWRKRLGQTLAARVVSTPLAAEEGDVVRFDFKRVTPGRMQDYIQLERDYLRLREAQVKAGAMKGWAMSTLVLPGGSEHEYDAFTIHIGKDLEQVLTWGRRQMDLAGKLDPPMNLIGLAMRGNDVQKIVRGETRVVTLAVRKP